MTDKQIIIDGVDVSKCEYWSGSELGYCNIGLWANDGTHICECEIDCLYKQLKRKEKECEELKKAEEYDSRYNDMQAEIDCGNAIVEKYHKCLIEIKEIIEQCVKIHDDIIVSKQILQKISEVLDGST